MTLTKDCGVVFSQSSRGTWTWSCSDGGVQHATTAVFLTEGGAAEHAVAWLEDNKSTEVCTCCACWSERDRAKWTRQ